MDTAFLFYAIDWLVANPLHALIGLMGAVVVLLTLMLLRVTSRSLAAMELVAEAQANGYSFQASTSSAADSIGTPQSAVPDTARVRATPTRSLRHSVSELLDIEESLLGLRELYWRKLIPLEVYAKESLKVGSRLKG